MCFAKIKVSACEPFQDRLGALDNAIPFPGQSLPKISTGKCLN